MTIQRNSKSAPKLHDGIGVYAIGCTANGRVYVGSSSRVRKRIHEHKSNLRSGKHICTALLADFIRYGESAFTFTVIECHTTIDDSFKAEKQILASLRDEGCLYNTQVPAARVVPLCRPSPDQRLVLTQTHSYRPIITMWPSVKAFGLDLGTTPDHARVMKMRDSIPAMYWSRLVHAAVKHGFHGVTYEVLAQIEAGKNGLLLAEAA